MARTVTLHIGHPRAGLNFTPLVQDATALTDSLVMQRGIVLTESMGLTDSRTVTSGAGLGLAPLGTTPLGG